MHNKNEPTKTSKRPRRIDISFLLNPEETPLKRARTNSHISSCAGSSGLSRTSPSSPLRENRLQHTFAPGNEVQPKGTTSDIGNSSQIQQLSQKHIRETCSNPSRPLTHKGSDTEAINADNVQSDSPQQATMTKSNQANNNHPKKTKVVTNNLPCDECDRCFCNEEAVKRHKIKQHPSGEKKSTSVQCPECKLILKCAQNLARHANTHGPGAEFECSQCQAKFVTKRSRSIHMRELHDWKPGRRSIAKVSFLCPHECGYASSQRTNVERHNENVHMGIRKFGCPCGYLASTKANLQTHMDVHQRNGKTRRKKTVKEEASLTLRRST